MVTFPFVQEVFEIFTQRFVFKLEKKNYILTIIFIILNCKLVE